MDLPCHLEVLCLLQDPAAPAAAAARAGEVVVMVEVEEEKKKMSQTEKKSGIRRADTHLSHNI